MDERKEKAQDAMDRALIAGVQQNEEKKMYDQMEVCLPFLGWDFIVNDGSGVHIGYTPKRLDVMESMNEYSDNPGTVKFMVISAPGMSHEDLLTCLYTSYELMKDDSRLSDGAELEKLRKQRETQSE